MKTNLSIKIMGEKEDINQVVSALEKEFETIATSRYLKDNTTDTGYFIFIDLRRRVLQ